MYIDNDLWGSFGQLLEDEPLGLPQGEVDALAATPGLSTFLDYTDPDWAVPQTDFGALPGTSLVGGHFPSGSGGSVNDFNNNTYHNLTLSTSFIHRQGNDYTPYHQDDNGASYYDGLPGAQVVDAGNGVFAANPNRYEGNFNFDVSTATGGSSETLQHFLLTHNIELVTKVNGHTDAVLHAVYDPSAATGTSPVVFEDSHGNVVINDNGGNAQVLANSENMAFASINPSGHVVVAGDQIDFTITASDKWTGHIIDQSHEVVTIGSSPIPHDAGLFGHFFGF